MGGSLSKPSQFLWSGVVYIRSNQMQREYEGPLGTENSRAEHSLWADFLLEWFRYGMELGHLVWLAHMPCLITLACPAWHLHTKHLSRQWTQYSLPLMWFITTERSQGIKGKPTDSITGTASTQRLLWEIQTFGHNQFCAAECAAESPRHQSAQYHSLCTMMAQSHQLDVSALPEECLPERPYEKPVTV